jgi:nickel-dependent lactate racemase
LIQSARAGVNSQIQKKLLQCGPTIAFTFEPDGKMPWISERAAEISWDQLQTLMEQTVAEARRRICARPKRVLLLPPDITRMHSGAGKLTEMLYRLFAAEADVYVIPTLGQHVPHTLEENRQMFGSIPNERIHAHDWRAGSIKIGELSGRFVDETTQGAADWPMPIVLNRMLMEEKWDLIINVGHVVPHEVLGFANHNKNYFIGLGGKDLICASHLAAASCGIENNLGCLTTPVRACFNRAEEEYLGHLPDLYVQVVLARNERDQLVHTGVYVGDDLETYLAAARQSREENITLLDEPIKKIVCVMQGDEFFSTWVANKSVYRTRMALADGGELIVIAPGLKRFGEQPEVDDFIRKYGYVGTPKVMDLYRQNADMQDLAHATAHLMHGSSEGRFQITYAPGHLTKHEVEGVNFQYADIQETIARYRPEACKQGWNTTADGERYYFIPTPSAGLWATREKLLNRRSGFGDE